MLLADVHTDQRGHTQFLMMPEEEDINISHTTLLGIRSACPRRLQWPCTLVEDRSGNRSSPGAEFDALAFLVPELISKQLEVGLDVGCPPP